MSATCSPRCGPPKHSTRTEIKTGQLNQLRSLAAHARAQTAWGRRHLPEELTWESFRALPVLDRVRSVARARTACCAVAAQHGTAHEVVTSGSTGTPVRVLKSFLIGSLAVGDRARPRLAPARPRTEARCDSGSAVGAVSGAPRQDMGGPAENAGRHRAQLHPEYRHTSAAAARLARRAGRRRLSRDLFRPIWRSFSASASNEAAACPHFVRSVPSASL